MRLKSQQLFAALLFGSLSCCTTIANAPINIPMHGVPPPAPPLADRLSRLPTSLSLPATDIDALIAGGRAALVRAPEYQNFLRSLGASGPRISSVGPGLPPA